MTPEELDAIEATYTLTDDAVDWHGESAVWEAAAAIPDLIAALREAWAEADQCIRDLRAGADAADERRVTINLLRDRAEKAEAEAERLLSELTALHPRTLAAEAALDRVRVVCDRLDEDPYDAWADATEAIRAAIEGDQ